jgi:pilus assembly protein CpaE
MHALIVSDHERTSLKAREVLLREGLDCPAASVLSLELAVQQLGGVRPDVIVVVLSPAVQPALAVLRQLSTVAPARRLVLGPASEPKLILQALRDGADQYLDESDLAGELTAALKRLRAEAGTQTENGRLIAVLAPSGGSGSSTLAANVATVLANKHGRCALVDLKLETGDLASLLDLKPTHTLADLCQNASRLDRVMFERSLVRHSSGVHLLAPPRSLADTSLVMPDGVRQSLTLARLLFPYVVLDLDHSFRDEQLPGLREADVILLVLRLDFTCVRHGRRTLEHLERLGIDRQRIQVVVNRYGQPKEVPAAKAEEALGMKILHYIADDPKAVNRANNGGVPVVLEAPSAKVSKNVARLAESINGRPSAGH